MLVGLCITLSLNMHTVIICYKLKIALLGCFAFHENCLNMVFSVWTWFSMFEHGFQTKAELFLTVLLHMWASEEGIVVPELKAIIILIQIFFRVLKSLQWQHTFTVSSILHATLLLAKKLGHLAWYSLRCTSLYYNSKLLIVNLFFFCLVSKKNIQDMKLFCRPLNKFVRKSLISQCIQFVPVDHFKILSWFTLWKVNWYLEV